MAKPKQFPSFLLNTIIPSKSFIKWGLNPNNLKGGVVSARLLEASCGYATYLNWLFAEASTPLVNNGSSQEPHKNMVTEKVIFWYIHDYIEWKNIFMPCELTASQVLEGWRDLMMQQIYFQVAGRCSILYFNWLDITIQCLQRILDSATKKRVKTVHLDKVSIDAHWSPDQDQQVQNVKFASWQNHGLCQDKLYEIMGTKRKIC